MKINEIIKKKRLEQNLTQTQIADHLGVSTPAVNKWEKGTSYPDVTILPPLARLLKVDLNTLLSFNEDLTEKEIWDYINGIGEQVKTLGFEKVFTNAMEKIREFPTCDMLILNLAITLFGLSKMFGIEKMEDSGICIYEAKCNSLFERCANSKDIQIKNQAISMLISKCTSEKDYEQAQRYIDMLPNADMMSTMMSDKSRKQGNLYIATGKLEEASKVFEEKLMQNGAEISSVLITMLEIALKEKRIEDAKYIANVIGGITDILDTWDYNSHLPYFLIYTTLKDKENTILTIEKMLLSMKKRWDTSATTLYKHIPKKPVVDQEHNMFFTMYLDSIKKDSDGTLEFLKDDSRLIELLEKYEKE